MNKIYSGWAFSEDEEIKFKINMGTYNKIKDLAKVELIGTGYATETYRVVENKHHLSPIELALICDKGNLCFGYRTEGSTIIIYTD